MRKWKVSVDTKVSGLNGLVTSLEQSRPVPSETLDRISQNIASLKAAADDAENKRRRNNLLIFGSPDKQTKIWDQLEESVVSLCVNRLDLTVDKPDIKRAYKIARY